MAHQTIKRSLLAAAIGGICATPAMAEDYTTGTMNATVRDQAGNTVANAEVLVTSDKGVRRTATTDSEGNIRVPQLPIGRYTVTVTGDGYAELVAENVPIQIGAVGAFTFTLEALDQAIDEIYVTGVRQGSWDFNTTTTGITVDVGEVFGRTPLARDATSIVLMAAGTGEGDTAFSTNSYGASGPVATFSGSSVGENVYYINGMNISNFRNFVGSSTVPFELFDQIEVKTGGYQAEFGRSTGGVTNAVTKSGSNEFKAGINAFAELDLFRSQSPATFTSANQHDEGQRNEMNFWASGALIEDRLFLFGLYNPRNISQFDCFSGSCEEQSATDPFYAVKLDFVPMDGHRLEYTYFSDDQTREVKTWRFTDAGNDRVGSASAMADGPIGDFKGEQITDSKYVNGGDNHILRYTAAISDWVTVSAMYGENNYARENFSDDSAPLLRDRRNTATGTNGSTVDIGTWSVGLFEKGQDERKNWRLDADFYFEFAGDHHVRVGTDKEELKSQIWNQYSGDLRARLEYSSLSATGQRWRIRRYNNEGGFETEQTAWYIQDSWQVTDDLTLNFGLRNETFENKNKFGDVYVETTDQLAPRVGFSFDPTGEATSRIFGSYGHYYLPIATNTNIRLAGTEVYYQEYYTAVIDAGGEPVYDSAGFPVFGPQIGTRSYFADGTLPFADATHAADLDPLYQSEWIIGGEHTFSNGWTVGARYIQRDLESLIEDVAIDAAVIAWAEANGYEDDPVLADYSGFHQYVLVNPGSSARIALVEDFGDDGIVDWVDFSAADLGYPEGERTYKAIDVTLEREWDGQWSVMANYTWSESEGNYEGAVKSENGQDDAGLTQDFDQPGLTDGAYGFLPNDRRHRLKLYGAYALNDQLVLSAAVNVEAPRAMGCVGEHPTDYFAWAYGAASWYCGGELTPRGSVMETDWVKTVDASLIWAPEWSMPGDGNLTLRVDVFNLLDAQAVVDRWEFGEYGYFSYNTAWDGDDPAVYYPADADTDFSKPTRYQRPRSVRLGVSYEF